MEIESRPASMAGLDLIAESLKNPVAVSFQTSTSAGYPLAAAIARQATQYAEAALTKKKMVHFAVFSSEAVQVARAHAVIKYIGHLKGVQVYAAGRALRFASSINEVLDCYLTAQSCTDWRAHCHTIIGPSQGLHLPDTIAPLNSVGYGVADPSKGRRRVTEYLIPCKFVARRAGFGLSRLSFTHPSGIEAQIQALAVQDGCAWCPRFNPSDHRPM